jgi:hypothetical protein
MHESSWQEIDFACLLHFSQGFTVTGMLFLSTRHHILPVRQNRA